MSIHRINSDDRQFNWDSANYIRNIQWPNEVTKLNLTDGYRIIEINKDSIHEMEKYGIVIYNSGANNVLILSDKLDPLSLKLHLAFNGERNVIVIEEKAAIRGRIQCGRGDGADRRWRVAGPGRGGDRRAEGRVVTLTIAGTPAGTVRVMVATKPVDFRKGAEGLAALVRETMGAAPFSGVIYVFRARRTDRVKLVWWDGTGVCLFAKRLEDGRFCWPSVTDGVVRLTAAQLQALLEGLDWRRVHATRTVAKPRTAS